MKTSRPLSPAWQLPKLAGFFAACLLQIHGADAQDRNIVMNIVYPSAAFANVPPGGDLTHASGGPMINIRSAPYSAKGDGVTDDTAAFKACIEDLLDHVVETGGLTGTGHGFSIYIPSGTYLVSDTLMHTSTVDFSRFRLVGQNRVNTTIKLRNNCPGFGTGAQKPVLTTYNIKDTSPGAGGLMWGNQIRNLTVDVGSGNPGAVGVVIIGANAMAVDNLTITGAGWCGLWLPKDSQQGHLCDITVDGFETGIRTEHVAESNPVFEYVTLRNQTVAGFHISRSAPCIRKLKSVNTCPAVSVNGDGAHCVLLDSELTGGGAASPAIRMTNSSKQQLFVRNVAVSGYSVSIEKDGSAAATGAIDEWRSGAVFRINNSTPAKSLNLPVEEAPLVPWASNPADWANPDSYSGSDFQKLQAALNSGKPAILLPRYFFTAATDILTIPATVKQIDMMHIDSWLWGGFRLNAASATPLFIENTGGRKPLIRVNAQRTVVARFGSLQYQVETAAPVTAHFQSIGVLANGHRTNFCPPNATIYGRSINEERWDPPENWLVNGGKMWVMGFKAEGDQTVFRVINNGFLEVLGGYVNFAGSSDQQNPDILNEASNVSYIGTNFMFRTHWEGIYEIRGGVTTKLRNDGRFPVRITGSSNNYFVPLYVGYQAGSQAAALSWDPAASSGLALGGSTAAAATEWKTAGGNIWWNGTSTTGWDNGNNATFAGTAGTVRLGSVISAGTLQFDTAGYVIDMSNSANSAANNLTLTGLSGAAATFRNSNTNSGSLTLSMAADTVWGGTIGNGGDRLNVTVNGGKALTVNSVLRNGGAFQQALNIHGAGTKLTLTGTGSTWASNFVSVNTGATLDIGTTPTFNARAWTLDGTSTITGSTGSRLLDGNPNSGSNFSGKLTGALAVETSDTTNAMTISGSTNDYSGGTFLTGIGGSVIVGGNSALGTGPVSMSSTNGRIMFRSTAPSIGALSTASATNNINLGNAAVALTGTWLANSNAITLTSGTTSGWVIGQVVSDAGGNGLVAGSYVTGITNGTQFTINVNTTGAGTNKALTSAAVVTNLNIGTLNTATTYAGVIRGLSSASGVSKSGTGTLTLGGANTYNGNTTVVAGALTISSSGELRFYPAANGVSNKLTGTGAANLSGSLSLNLAAAAVAHGNAWTLVDVTTRSYSLAGISSVNPALVFTRSSGVWTAVDGNRIWTFTESNGVLSLALTAAGGYITWSATHAGNGDPGADSDSDGVKNGIEYFMNSIAPATTVLPGLDPTNTITWPNGGKIPGSGYGTQFVVQTSVDLVEWAVVPVGSLVSNTDGPGGAVAYKVTAPGNQFVRLKVTPIP